MSIASALTATLVPSRAWWLGCCSEQVLFSFYHVEFTCKLGLNRRTHMSTPIAQAEWKLGINDPSIVAWVVFGLYLIASFLCWESSRAAAKMPERDRRPSSWGLLSLLLLLLAVNKQLDLHTLVMRQLREFQIARVTAIIGFLIVSALAMTLMAVFRRLNLSKRLKVAYVSLLLIIVFQALRFSSMPMTELLTMHPLANSGLFHTHVIEILELLLVGLICYYASNLSNSRSTKMHS